MKFLKKTLVATVTFAYAVSSSAGALDDQMKKSFGSLTNVTNAGSYEGQTRGVITGGNMYVRNKIVERNLVSFKAPSIKAGCGGIDIYKGSLSFISGPEFEALLQAIAANARGYAFELALDIVCPTCNATMKELQKKIQEMTAGLLNSCEMAKYGVNALTPLQTWAESSRAEASTAAANVDGLFDNIYDAWPWKKDGGKPTSATDKMSPAQRAKAGLTGNITWKALLKNNVSAWYGLFGGNELNQVMMSVAGTVIMKPGTGANDNSTVPNVEIVPIVREGIVKLEHLLYGGTDVKVFSCTDGTGIDECLEIGEVNQSIEGMEAKVRVMMMGGTSPSGTSTGIISKLRQVGGASTFSVEEKAFIEAASPGILGVLRDFAHDQRSARAVADIFSQTLAQEMAISFVTEMLSSVNEAVENAENVNGGAKSKAGVIIQRAMDEVHKTRASNALTLAGVSNAFQIAAYMRTNLQSRVSAEREVPEANK